MNGRVRRITFYLHGRIRHEGEWYVAECIGLPVAGQGENPGEALASLTEAVHLFVETCIARGTLEQVLLKYRWRPSLQPFRETGPRGFTLPVMLPQIVQRALDECRA